MPTGPIVGAVGIAVADLDRSTDFYTRVAGLSVLMRLALPEMDEVILGYPGSKGAAVVLMHYTDGSDPAPSDLPVKLVFYVPDPQGFADAVAAEGLAIVRKPAPVPELGGTLVGFVKDPDGYTIELLQG
jgi:catechol 2,3-dioxygenase-like lactoylglutathione lyase family enzyme